MLALLRGRLFKQWCRIRGRNIAIGDDLKLFCRLTVSGPGKVIIGDNCTIRGLPGSRTQHVTLLTNSPEAVIRIGDNVALNAAKLSCRFSITVGDDVIVEDASLMDTDFHSLEITREIPSNESLERCAITIGKGTGISARSIITKGVTLGACCLVAPSSLVRDSFPDHSVILGNPAIAIDRQEDDNAC